MSRSCLGPFISHREGGWVQDLSKDPSNRVALSEREASFSPRVACCFQFLFFFSFYPPSQSQMAWRVSHLLISDSETTEDETTEPQMETKEGPGRHQDKAGRRGPSGTISPLLLGFMSTLSIFSTLRLTSCKESVRFTEVLTSLPSRDAHCCKKKIMIQDVLRAAMEACYRLGPRHGLDKIRHGRMLQSLMVGRSRMTHCPTFQRGTCLRSGSGCAAPQGTRSPENAGWINEAEANCVNYITITCALPEFN